MWGAATVGRLLRSCLPLRWCNAWLRIGPWTLLAVHQAPRHHVWRYRDGAGHLGVIASISAPFCGDCNRIRVTADGQVFTCLFASQGVDLRPYLRAGEPETQLRERLSDLWTRRSDRFSEERRLRGDVDKPHAEMAYLGG